MNDRPNQFWELMAQAGSDGVGGVGGADGPQLRAVV